MNKKKLVSLCLVLALLVTAAVGATFAYFTDTDTHDNVFTVGNVKIDLIEQDRDGNGELTGYDYDEPKPLNPIVGSAQGEKDNLGLPVAKNYVDKVVTVENKGANDAWVRAYFAIPSVLDDGYDTFNASLNVLHFNFGSEAGRTTYQNEWIWKNADGSWKYYETTINDVAYNVYYADYKDVVPAGETTVRLLNGVYLDKSVDYDGENYSMIKNNNQRVTIDLKGLNLGNVVCPVYAVAVQEEGFANADEAVTEAFGAQYNPWGGAVSRWQ